MNLLQGIWNDLAFGARTQLKSPGVTAVAVLTVAFGIGANSFVFSWVNSLLLRPLPVEEPERLVRIYSEYASGPQYFTVSYPDYVDIREAQTVFSAVLVDRPVPVSLRAGGRNERVWGYLVSANYFSMLGVEPALGRFFNAEEGRTPGAHPVAMLSYGLWQRWFGGSRSVLGETLILNGRHFVVIGIAPENFHGVNLGLLPDLWLPVMMEGQLVPGGDTLDKRGNRGYFVMGRLQPGVTVEKARRALELLARQLQDSYPNTNEGIRFVALPEAEGRIHPMVRGGFLGFSGVLVVVAILVLLLACANVAGILLIRAEARRKEIGLRMAVGGSRGRVVRQLLTEGAFLSLLAGGLGLALTWVAITVLLSIELPTDVPIFIDLRLDRPLLGFCFVVALLTGILFGLAPALQASRADLVRVLKDSGSTPGLRRSRLRNTLVFVQIAVSTTLLIGAGLFLRSLQKAHEIDLGFNPQGVVMASLDLSLQGYEVAEGKRFWLRLIDRLSSLSGTQSVSLASTVPFELNITRISIAPLGYQPPRDSGLPSIDFAVVDRDYFETLGIPILDGRDLGDEDDDGSPLVAIVNDVLARQFWHDGRAVGKRLVNREEVAFEVVGVVRGGKYLTLGEEPKPYLYLPFRQSSRLAMTVLVRGSGDPSALLREVRQEIHAMDESLPQYNVKTMREHLTVALAPTTLGATLLGIISIIALTLASVGLYGTMAYAVARRTYEIGIRRALGAQNRDVIWLVVRQAMVLVFIGLASGILLSLGATWVLRSLLYGVQPADPVAVGLASLVLLVVSSIACYIPARQATEIEAVSALHQE